MTSCQHSQKGTPAFLKKHQVGRMNECRIGPELPPEDALWMVATPAGAAVGHPHMGQAHLGMGLGGNGTCNPAAVHRKSSLGRSVGVEECIDKSKVPALGGEHMRTRGDAVWLAR